MEPENEATTALPLANNLERLRRMREGIGDASTLDCPVPGYQDQLYLRFAKVDWGVLRHISRKHEKNKATGELLAQADVLIAAFEAVLLRPAEGADAEILTNAQGDPIGMEKQLAEAFGFKAESARQVIFGLFNNDVALVSCHNDYIEWRMTSGGEDDEDFVGE